MNDLALELLDFFYDRNETLQKDFEEFAATEEYKQLMERSGKEELIEWLTPKRFKVCQTCGRPFISMDQGNRSKFCSYKTYRKHTKEGEPFKATERGKSECLMESRRRWKRAQKERELYGT